MSPLSRVRVAGNLTRMCLQAPNSLRCCPCIQLLPIMCATNLTPKSSVIKVALTPRLQSSGQRTSHWRRRATISLRRNKSLISQRGQMRLPPETCRVRPYSRRWLPLTPLAYNSSSPRWWLHKPARQRLRRVLGIRNLWHQLDPSRRVLNPNCNQRNSLSPSNT